MSRIRIAVDLFGYIKEGESIIARQHTQHSPVLDSQSTCTVHFIVLGANIYIFSPIPYLHFNTTRVFTFGFLAFVPCGFGIFFPNPFRFCFCVSFSRCICVQLFRSRITYSGFLRIVREFGFETNSPIAARSARYVIVLIRFESVWNKFKLSTF